MTNWIVTRTGRFKAASAGASLSDRVTTPLLIQHGDLDWFTRRIKVD